MKGLADETGDDETGDQITPFVLQPWHAGCGALGLPRGFGPASRKGPRNAG
jgi:hypothetical protein